MVPRTNSGEHRLFWVPCSYVMKTWVRRTALAYNLAVTNSLVGRGKISESLIAALSGFALRIFIQLEPLDLDRKIRINIISSI